MLKINLTHLFEPSGIHWLKLGVGGCWERAEIKKKTVDIWEKSWWELSQDNSYTEAFPLSSARAEITHIHTPGKHLSLHGLHPKAADTLGLFENAVFLSKCLT